MLSSLGYMIQPVLGLLSEIPGMRKNPLPLAPARPFEGQPATSRDELDSMISRLHASAKTWVDLPISSRIDILQKVLKNTLDCGQYLASDCVQAKGSSGGGLGEEL